jgi:hypothetical protein
VEGRAGWLMMLISASRWWGNQSAHWSKLNQSLYAVTFVAQGEREKSKNCMLCLESDHTEEQCALYIPPQKAPKLANQGRRSGNDQTTS